MQSMLLGAVLFSLHPVSLALSVTAAEGKAATWLRAHRGKPQPDELAELKTENPEAYGLVKALLMKRSLGLLDPRHPTASFAAARAPPAEEAVSGPAAFQKIAEESGEKPKAALPYADAPVSAHHDWLNWKPQQSAMDDESMVQNVLGSVAQLKGSQPSSPAATEELPAEPQVEASAKIPAEPQVEAPAKPLASMSQSNSYLKGIDFGLGAQPARSRESTEENSYLKGIDLGGEEKPLRPRPIGLSSVKKSQSTKNYLADFSWDDDSHPKKAKAQPVVSAPAEKKPAHKDALLAWLSPEKAPTKPPAAKAGASKENSYLKDLDLY